MTAPAFIGIDQGSSSTKALVVDGNGAVLFQGRKDLAPPLREGPRIEQDPREILTSVEAVLLSCMQFARSSERSVLGIGLACQRSSCLVWNEQTGEPLSPVLSWRDARGEDLVGQMADRRQTVYETTGLPLTPYYSASKFRWLRENVPAAAQASSVFGTLSSFLTHRLTGGERAVIDHTNAARTLLMDIGSLDWDGGLLDLFGLSGIRLPGIRPTAYPFGTVRTAAGEAPLLASIGDQQAAMIGLGVMDRGEGGINYGTGGFLMAGTGADLVRAPGLMASILFSTAERSCFLLEGSVNAVGDGLEWIRTGLGLFSEYDDVDDLCWKETSDVVVFMGLNGTGAPHWERDISTSIHGLSGRSTGADIVRGAVEGIAFFMNDIAEAIRTAGIEMSSFSVAGGLSSLSYLVQVQADILGTDVRLGAFQEVSALGAALLAGLSQGAWDSAKFRSLTPPGEIVSPRENAGAERRYRRWRELHRATGIIDRIHS